MREGTRVDAEGFHCFNLDERAHDPFVVLNRLIAACDKAAGVVPAVDPGENARFAEIMRKQRAALAR